MEMQGYEAAAAQGPPRLGTVDSQSSQGKALYVGNLHSSVSQEMLQVRGAGRIFQFACPACSCSSLLAYWHVSM